MSYTHTFYTTLALSTLLLSGCGGGSSDTTTEDSTPTEVTQGENRTFYLDTSSSGETTTATLRTISSDISTKFGNKTLNIWVSNDSFDSGLGCQKSKCVTQEMVDALAQTFLQDGDDNDVYDWVTNIFGEEWGADAQKDNSNFIGETNSIDILLTDIDDDNTPNGGVIGYFWSKDNYKSSVVSGSNERIMFYVDAVMFANGDTDDTWSINDMWPKEMVSTLAHEFQHMIHFYEKTIPLNESSDIWLNEMLSETVEDVIATKIEHTGPRGVDYEVGSAGESGNTLGRYPLFNDNNTLSLTQWGNTLADYSTVNAFGAFLTRNYGGAQVLHDILYSDKTDERAVEESTNQSFGTLLQEWGEAVILSSVENPDTLPTYNFGDFLDVDYNNITYNLGSINFYNYSPTPYFYEGSSFDATIQAHANAYYRIGEDLSGDVDIDLTLDDGVKAMLIAISGSSVSTEALESASYTVSLEDHSDLYVLLTNTNASSNSNTTVTNNAKYVAKQTKVAKEVVKPSPILPTPSHITQFNAQLIAK
jgi:hypothetical protein